MLLACCLSACSASGSATVSEEIATASLCMHAALLPLTEEGPLEFLPFSQSPGTTREDNLRQAILALRGDVILLAASGNETLSDRVEKVVETLEFSTEELLVSVFLTDAVTDEQRDHIAATIEGIPGVSAFHYESKEDAYRRFKDIFANEPSIVENVDPAALPASFRVTLTDEESALDLRDAVASIPGVKDVSGARVRVHPQVSGLLHDLEELCSDPAK